MAIPIGAIFAGATKLLGSSRKAKAAKMGAKGGKSAGRRMAAKITSSEYREKKPEPKPTSTPSIPLVSSSVSSPLFKKTGIKSIDSSFQNISKELGNTKVTLKSDAVYDKAKENKDQQANLRSRRERREARSESIIGGAIGSVVGALGGVGSSFFDKLKNFFIQILIGGILLWVQRNIKTITSTIKNIAEKVKEAFDFINDNIIQPLWNAAKVIVGPIVKEITKLITGIPDFEAENNTILENLNKLALEIPILGGFAKQIQGAVDNLKLQVPSTSSPGSTPSGSTPPSATPSSSTTSGPTPPAARAPLNAQRQPASGGGGATPPAMQKSGPMTSGGYDMKLAKLLKDYEGLRTKAYLDSVGIPTIGMGATYYPKGFRLSGNVQMGQTITEEEALWIKTEHIKEHRQRLLRELPSSIYNKLPPGVKAALESKVFNYGSLGGPLTNLVTEASKTGNYKPVSNYFRNVLARHDGGINSWRRNDEAGLIDGGKSARNGVNFGTSVTPPAARPQQSQAPSAPNVGTNAKRPTSSGATAFVLPKGRVGTGAGQVYGAPRDYGGHAGIDLVEKPPWGADPKIPVVAYKDGVVIAKGPVYPYTTSGYTSNLSIDHGDGLVMTYLHMTPGLAVGTQVKAGQQVGKLIDLGDQTHLHLEAYRNGKKFDPTSLMGSAGKAAPPARVAPSSSSSQPTVSKSASYDQRGGRTVVVPAPSSGGASRTGAGGQRSRPANPSNSGSSVNKNWTDWFKNSRLFRGG